MDLETVKINFQRRLDMILSSLNEKKEKPSLLLHSCCGPCSSYVVTYLMDFFDITVLFYNPNIFPEEEYDLRLKEQKRLLSELGIPIIDLKYDHKEFLDHVKGLENIPEGGERCRKCFELRLSKTRDMASFYGFSYFCTTLTVSPHKNAAVINEVGSLLEKNDPGSCVSWLLSDFKKKDGYKRSIELSAEYGLYRQDYCGCEFSL